VADPLCYVHGYGEVLPGLEAGLAGAEVGEERALSLPPEEAFGERDPEAELEIDRHDFPGGETVAVGDEIIAEGPDGVEAVHHITGVTDNAILVDLNHPLAGQRVRFEALVCSIRAATDAELDAAQARADDRIVYASSIVYGSQPPPSSGAGSGGDPQLIQLRPRTTEPHPSDPSVTEPSFTEPGPKEEP
jgi:FKBP-type peptidyl-prolyl cis-trans isomerase SlyD